MVGEYTGKGMPLAIGRGRSPNGVAGKKDGGNVMKTQKTIMGLITLAIILGSSFAPDAEAGIRVNAILRTPNVRVHYTNSTNYHHGHVRVIEPTCDVNPLRITQRDRKIARRLSNYTGVSARRMLQMRRDGYYWGEIGNWIGVRHFVVVAARNGQSWKRFLREEARLAGCDDDRRPKRKRGRG